MYEPPTLGDHHYESMAVQNGSAHPSNTYYFEPTQLSADYQYQLQQQRLIYNSAQHVDNRIALARQQASCVGGSVRNSTNYLLYGPGNPSGGGMMPRGNAANLAGSCNNDSPGTGGTGNSNVLNGNAALAASGAMTRNVFGYDDCYKANGGGNTCFPRTTTNTPSFCLEASQSITQGYMPTQVAQYGCMTNDNLTHHNIPYFSGQFANTVINKSTVIPKLERCSPETAEYSADYFCSVPGRLSLLSSTSKYKVSVAEIHRRISQPECLNASLLGGILRRAKSKNGGKLLRQRLESIGVKLPAGRRKATTITVLTAMVEGEALQLASDFDSICKTEFPTKDCAVYLRKRKYSKMVDEPSSADNLTNDNVMRETKVAKKFAEDFLQLLHDDRSPTTIRNEMPILEESVQRPLTRFSMMTHGFGIPAMITAMEAYIGYLSDLEETTITIKGTKRTNQQKDCGNNGVNLPPKRKRIVQAEEGDRSFIHE